MMRRALLAYGLLAALVVVIGLSRGVPTAGLLLVQATIYALIALGLNIQFGYGGLFNFAVMGMLMVGAMVSTIVSTPVNMGFWSSDGPMLVSRAILAALGGAVLVAIAHEVTRRTTHRTLAFWVRMLAWFIGYVAYRTQIDPAAAYIETTPGVGGWIGGFGQPVLIGWALGGAGAAIAAFVIGRISLGLRSDYLAIATIGMSEIIRAFVKNMDWLTRGTLTVTPIPWPVPTVESYQDAGLDTPTAFLYGQGGFLILAAGLLLLAVLLTERAYWGPWGRTMRAIRDNDVAAGSMGKNVKSRQIELFVLGSAHIGVGGAALSSFQKLFDPSGYIPINNTFLVWVMVIVGGMGNSFGAVLGALGIYLLWTMSEPVSRLVFDQVSQLSTTFGWGAIPDIDARAAQMRVFVLGLVITLALRFAPKGILPERIRRSE